MTLKELIDHLNQIDPANYEKDIIFNDGLNSYSVKHLDLGDKNKFTLYIDQQLNKEEKLNLGLLILK